MTSLRLQNAEFQYPGVVCGHILSPLDAWRVWHIAEQGVEVAIDARGLLGFVIVFGDFVSNCANVRAEAKTRPGDTSIPVSRNGCSRPSVW